MNFKEHFRKHIIETYSNSEVALVVGNDTENQFQNLCQKFLDVALNAQKVKTEDGKLAGVFQYADIDIAKFSTIEFIHSYKIQDIDMLLKIIESEYSESGDPGDKRQKSGFLREENINGSFGYTGTLYLFTQISDDVFNKIKDEIKAMV